MVHYHDRDSWKSEFPEQIRDPGQSIPKIRDPGENEVKKSEIPEKIRDPGSTKNPSLETRVHRELGFFALRDLG